MMFLIGLELTRFVRDVRPGRDLIPLIATVAAALLSNMAVGFAAGLAAHHIIIGTDRYKQRRK